MKKSLAALIFLILLWIPSPVMCSVLKSDTVWSGEVSVTEDLLIPEGVSLTIRPGTVIKISPSESTRTDPEYMSSLTEITVRGVLKAGEEGKAPVLFVAAQEEKAWSWAGIIIDGGEVVLNSCNIQNAESGIYVINGAVDVKNSSFSENRYGLAIQGKDAMIRIERTTVSRNDYGMLLLNNARVENIDSVFKGNTKKDVYSPGAGNYRPVAKEYRAEKIEKGRSYGNEVLLGLTVWQDRVEINGLVRIPEKSRLIIMPGTVVEFRKKDTNNDGIGENGLLIQGVIIAKGTAEKPIFFRSAEKEKAMGDWDAINVMSSDGAQNLIEYCQIEDAYRGLHFHFSNAAIKDSVLRNNYRGIQFQESAVEVRGTYIYGNKSGLQARDSEIYLNDNYIFDNYSGVYIFRVNGIISDNSFVANYREGLRVREGIPVVEKNIFNGNRFGLTISYSIRGSFSSNVISNNLESGIAIKGADDIEISGNFIQGNGLNGISVLDTRAVIKGNYISGNEERGIGIVSFEGTITENNFVDNGQYAMGIDGAMNVSAPMNWWGGAAINDVIFDKNDDPKRGSIDYEEPAREPFAFTWPLNTVFTDATWKGVIHILRTTTVPSSVKLKIMPNTRIIFAAASGLNIYGVLEAIGEKDARIVFTSLEKSMEPYWEEILLEQTRGILLNCDFEGATMALHSHFSNLKIHGCNFRNNNVGIAFRGGPVEISQSLFEGNMIGIKPFLGNAFITGNVITKNETGVFVREEKSGGVVLTKNNIFDNNAYNIRLGDFNRANIDAKENWWGEGNPEDMIYDDRKEPDVGRVFYEPFAQKPFITEITGRN